MQYVSTGIPGLLCVPEYLSPEEEQRLTSQIDNSPWLTDLKRRVQHYGWRYDYKKRAVNAEMYLGALPAWLIPLAQRLSDDGFIDGQPDQAIINEYEPGQGIASHVDCIPCFSDTIISLSLGSACVMDFSRISPPTDIAILLQARALLVMKDEARYRWKHAIAPRKTDIVNGEVIERGRRLSLTFRRVIPPTD